MLIPPELESPVNNDCSNLKLGETCYRNGVEATVSHARVSACKNGILEFDLKIKNSTSGTKNVKIHGSNLSVLVDNVNQSRVFWTSNQSTQTRCDTAIPLNNSLYESGRKLVTVPFDLPRLSSLQQETYHYIIFGNLGTENREISVQLTNSDPIDDAVWKVDIADL